MSILSVYCDGSSHAKGGLPIGWAFCLVVDNQLCYAGTGCSESGTNNVAELTAAIDGLEAAKLFRKEGQLVELVSDSQYTLGSATGAYVAVKNVELVQRLQALYKEVCWRTRWIAGHSGDEFNEMCDQLAKAAKQATVDSLKARK